jgi:hypothetical protein
VKTKAPATGRGQVAGACQTGLKHAVPQQRRPGDLKSICPVQQRSSGFLVAMYDRKLSEPAFEAVPHPQMADYPINLVTKSIIYQTNNIVPNKQSRFIRFQRPHNINKCTRFMHNIATNDQTNNKQINRCNKQQTNSICRRRAPRMRCLM